MAIVKRYFSKIISIAHHYENLYTIEFRNETGIFKFNPGQFLHLAIDSGYEGSGQWPESRCFSMQSKPGEETLKITYSVIGSFTRQMETVLKPGLMVWLKLPYGNLFTQPHNKTNTVFIAGGTGITPFLSLFSDQSFNQYINPRIYLGFRSKEYNIYLEEMGRSFNSSKLLKYFYENTDGVLDINRIYEENGGKSDYFISGPPVMSKTFKEALMGKGIPINQILTDDWV